MKNHDPKLLAWKKAIEEELPPGFWNGASDVFMPAVGEIFVECEFTIDSLEILLAAMKRAKARLDRDAV